MKVHLNIHLFTSRLGPSQGLCRWLQQRMPGSEMQLIEIGHAATGGIIASTGKGGYSGHNPTEMLAISNRCHHIPLLFGFQFVLTQCHDTDSSAWYHYEKEMVIVQWGEVTGRGHLPQTSGEKKGRKVRKRLKMVRERITDKDTTLSWIVSLIGGLVKLHPIHRGRQHSPCCKRPLNGLTHSTPLVLCIRWLFGSFEFFHRADGQRKQTEMLP